MIDFEKDFDSISWNFIYQTLDIFNFGQPIKYWFKHFIMMYIHVSNEMDSLQNTLNPKETVGRVTQFHLFLLCAGILGILIRDKDIKGITIDGEEYKISQ